MKWIDNKKASDIVPKNWIISCLKMYKISDKVIKFITEAMKKWQMELIAGEKSLTGVEIQRGIFQGGTLSPINFVRAMISFSYIQRKCIGGYKITESK